MHAIVTLAIKDLRLLLRNRASLFFTFVWPLLIAIGLGAMLSGSMGGGSKVGVALVDEDGSARSAAFLARLETATELDAMPTSRAEAEDAVRTGRRTAFVIVPKGFGEASERLFYGTPPTVQLGLDPSRRAESGMLEGVLMKYGVQEMQTVFSDPDLGHRAVLLGVGLVAFGLGTRFVKTCRRTWGPALAGPFQPWPWAVDRGPWVGGCREYVGSGFSRTTWAVGLGRGRQ